MPISKDKWANVSHDKDKLEVNLGLLERHCNSLGLSSTEKFLKQAPLYKIEQLSTSQPNSPSRLCGALYGQYNAFGTKGSSTAQRHKTRSGKASQPRLPAFQQPKPQLKRFNSCIVDNCALRQTSGQHCSKSTTTGKPTTYNPHYKGDNESMYGSTQNQKAPNDRSVSVNSRKFVESAKGSNSAQRKYHKGQFCTNQAYLNYKIQTIQNKHKKVQAEDLAIQRKRQNSSLKLLVGGSHSDYEYLQRLPRQKEQNQQLNQIDRDDQATSDRHQSLQESDRGQSPWQRLRSMQSQTRQSNTSSQKQPQNVPGLYLSEQSTKQQDWQHNSSQELQTNNIEEHVKMQEKFISEDKEDDSSGQMHSKCTEVSNEEKKNNRTPLIVSGQNNQKWQTGISKGNQKLKLSPTAAKTVHDDFCSQNLTSQVPKLQLSAHSKYGDQKAVQEAVGNKISNATAQQNLHGAHLQNEQHNQSNQLLLQMYLHQTLQFTPSFASPNALSPKPDSPATFQEFVSAYPYLEAKSGQRISQDDQPQQVNQTQGIKPCKKDGEYSIISQRNKTISVRGASLQQSHTATTAGNQIKQAKSVIQVQFNGKSFNLTFQSQSYRKFLFIDNKLDTKMFSKQKTTSLKAIHDKLVQMRDMQDSNYIVEKIVQKAIKNQRSCQHRERFSTSVSVTNDGSIVGVDLKYLTNLSLFDENNKLKYINQVSSAWQHLTSWYKPGNKILQGQGNVAGVDCELSEAEPKEQNTDEDLDSFQEYNQDPEDSVQYPQSVISSCAREPRTKTKRCKSTKRKQFQGNDKLSKYKQLITTYNTSLKDNVSQVQGRKKDSQTCSRPSWTSDFAYHLANCSIKEQLIPSQTASSQSGYHEEASASESNCIQDTVRGSQINQQQLVKGVTHVSRVGKLDGGPVIIFAGLPESRKLQDFPKSRVPLFVRFNGIANSAIRLLFKQAGFRRTGKSSKSNVIWGAVLASNTIKQLTSGQRANHFLGTWELGRKDRLYRNVEHMKATRGDPFDIVPQFYILPRHIRQFKADYNSNPQKLFILKPLASSCGRGVRIISKPSQLPTNSSGQVRSCIVQKYVHQPLLINGFKCDLRLYVAVTCFEPLRVYVYNEGLVRFATEQYSKSKSSLKHRRMHLTNSSVNKSSKQYIVPDKIYSETDLAVGGKDYGAGLAQGEAEEDPEYNSVNGTAEQDSVHLDGYKTGKGDKDNNEEHEPPKMASKWQLLQLRQYLEINYGVSWEVIWAQVHDICAAAIISAEPKCSTLQTLYQPNRRTCFEVYGVDVLLDKNLKAWLLEVNTCPALNCQSDLDRYVKYSMLSDLMQLVGIPAVNVQKQQQKSKQLTLKRLQSTSRLNTYSHSVDGSVSSVGNSVCQSQRLPKKSPSFTTKSVKDARISKEQDSSITSIIQESEQELQRACGWERVIPCLQCPVRYQDWFERPKQVNLLLSQYYVEKQLQQGK